MCLYFCAFKNRKTENTCTLYLIKNSTLHKDMYFVPETKSPSHARASITYESKLSNLLSSFLESYELVELGEEVSKFELRVS